MIQNVRVYGAAYSIYVQAVRLTLWAGSIGIASRQAASIPRQVQIADPQTALGRSAGNRYARDLCRNCASKALPYPLTATAPVRTRTLKIHLASAGPSSWNGSFTHAPGAKCTARATAKQVSTTGWRSRA